MNETPKGDEHYAHPDQLCIGMHVHLDLSWVEHPFTFSSFKIKTPDQISTIQSLDLKRVRYSPNKSDAEPLPPRAVPLGTAASAVDQHDNDLQYLAKRARLERLEAQRAKAAACEKEFLSSTRAIKSINQNMFAQPALVRQQADDLVKAMTDSMLMEVDIAIQLMADKIGNEDVYFHSLNVALLSMMLAKEMKAPPAAIHLLGLAALFHDAGDADIPERVVRKTDAHTRAEIMLLQQHCAYGVEIAKKIGLPPEVQTVILQHHEHVDGSGYPKALQGPQLSLLSRIVAIVNAYDELCNPVNPAKAMTPHEALSTLYAQQRESFDPQAMAVFVRCMGVYPPGTVVALSNGVLAMVVSVNTTRPLKPTVLVYDPAVPKSEAIVVDLEQEPEVTVVKTLKPQQLPPAVFDYLSPRKRTSYYFSAEAGKSPG
jgi:putative nucleotidyltransferase with HDIG domain